MKKILLLFLLSILYISVVHAQDISEFYYNWGAAFESFNDPNTGLTAFPTLLIPMGGKYEAMGTAYTAVSDDSGFIEANPAASAVQESSELSFVHHSWIADVNFEGVIYTNRFDDLGIAACGKFLYIPFVEKNEWGEPGSKGYISETIGMLNIGYNFLSSYYFYGLSVGTNLKFAFTHVPNEIYPDQSLASVMADFGVLTRLDLLKFYQSTEKNFSIGAAFKNLGPFANGEPLPMIASVGIAYKPIRPLTVAVDFNLPVSFDYQNFPAERWDMATGINVNVTDFLALQAGFRFKADNPRFSLGSVVDLGDMGFLVNYNLDLSGSLNPLDKLSIVARFDLGDNGRGDNITQAKEAYLRGLDLYAQGKVSQAIASWERAIELDPKLIPAREQLELARKRLELEEELQARQEVED